MSTVQISDNVRSDTLSNGITVVTEQMPHVRSVSVGIWVTAGSRNETPPQNGISHFIEHMLFKGTENRTAEDIARQVDSMGAHLDAFTSKELVCFNAKMLDEHLPLAFDILSDMMLRPLFNEEDIEKEKGVVLEELKMEADNPEYIVHDIFSASVWKGHSLGRSILGTRQTISSFTRSMLREYSDRMYVTGNMVITAAGNLTHEAFVSLVEQQFGRLPRKETTAPDATPRPHAKLTLKNKRSLEQAHLCLGVPSHPLPHDMRYSSYVLNTVLGGGISSRLFQNIREKRGLAYSVGSEQFLYRDSGLFSIYAGTSTASVPELLQLVLAEFRDLKKNPVPHEELRRAKDNLKGSLMLGLESTGSRMSHLARQFIYFKRFPTMDEIIESIEKVSAEDIVSLAGEYFQTDRIALTVLGKLNGLKVERRHLAC